jgi:hypothetical protein
MVMLWSEACRARAFSGGTLKEGPCGGFRLPSDDQTVKGARVTRHTSHLTPHTSHLTPHTSHLTPHTSHLTPHTPHLTHVTHVTHHLQHDTTRAVEWISAARGSQRPAKQTNHTSHPPSHPLTHPPLTPPTLQLSSTCTKYPCSKQPLLPPLRQER